MPRQNVPPRKTALQLNVEISKAVNTFQELYTYREGYHMLGKTYPPRKTAL